MPAVGRVVLSFGLALLLASFVAHTDAISIASDDNVIEVFCPSPDGCLGILKNIIATAPEGAVLDIAPGTYYEPTLEITKSLTLRGQGYASTFIQAVYSPLLSIRAERYPITVRFEHLNLSSPVLTPEYLPLLAMIASQTEEPSQVVFEDVVAFSGKGIVAKGSVHLVIQDSALHQFTGHAISMGEPSEGEGQRALTLINSDIIVATEHRDWTRSGDVAIDLWNVQRVTLKENLIKTDLTLARTTAGLILVNDVVGGQAIFENNKFYGRHGSGVGVMGPFVGQDGVLKTRWVGNTIKGMVLGFQLGGHVQAELVENVIQYNQVGLYLYLSPCHEENGVNDFTGTISGRDNVIARNEKMDLCPGPDEYPWPPNFVKAPETPY